MTPRTRQEAIVRHLRRNGTATVAALADDVGASRRTIIRDIGALREEGYILNTDPGPGGGVQLDPGSVQTTARLAVTEVFALLISVATMRAAQTLPFSQMADAGLAKIEKALPPDRVRDLRLFLDCLHVGQLSPQQDLSDVGPIDPQLLPAFEQAFFARTQMSFAYRDAQGRQTQRQIEPQAMLILPPLWYIVGWDPARDDFRYFRMDRIGAPKIMADAPFRRRHVPFQDDVSPYKQARA